MTTLKQGDLIKDKNEKTRSVLGVCGEVIHISFALDHNAHYTTATESQLKKRGYTWDTPAWEPSIEKDYWFIIDGGTAIESTWDNHKVDHARRDFLGIYETEALAKAALLEIRRKLGK